MLINWIRTIYSDNGALTDQSLNAQNGQGFSAVLTLNEDYVYFGQTFPFNNLYFKIGTANSTTATIGVQYWSATGWYDAVNVLDSTSTGGKTLAQNGVIMWTPDDDYGFTQVADTTDSNAPAQLNGITIYNMYWVRMKASATLSGTTSVNKVTYAFTNDSAITALDPDINEYLTNWSAGKTNWVDQIIIASNNVIVDLKGKGLISNPAQILKFDELYLAVAYKTLAIIYNGLGDKFIQKRDYANAQYNAIINTVGLTVDTVGTAIPYPETQSARKGYLVR
jgi:hypothetical protein